MFTSQLGVLDNERYAGLAWRGAHAFVAPDQAGRAG
jgi:hypothetical protein